MELIQVYDYITDPNSFSIGDKLLIPIAGALLLLYIKVKGLRKYQKATVILTFLAIVLSIVSMVGGYKEYTDIVAKIEAGDLKTIEGPITDFRPLDLENHGSLESYKINGELFAYSDYHQIPGYHHACHFGGLVCNENQVIKVTYHTQEGINYIVKLWVDKSLLPQKQ